MRYGIDQGYRFLDFGRSTRGDGTFEAKRQWGADSAQLHWVYEPNLNGQAGEASRKHGKAAHLWQHLPVALTKLVGPWIRKGLPS